MRIRLDSVTHRFKDLSVLEDISVDIGEGEVVAIIGPSGCGKSTLLSIIGGLLAPTAGRILTSGSVPPGCLNPFTYVFQDFSILPWRTVCGNVRLGLEASRLSPAERDERIARVLAAVDLDDFADVYPKQLSGGMRQRVGIARALAVHPAVLLMDEPLSALDAQTRELLMEDFLSIWAKEKTTAVYVTHNLDEALRLADRIVVLSRRPGRIKHIATVGIHQSERATESAQRTLASLHNQLWSLIKEEARMADREVING